MASSAPQVPLSGPTTVRTDGWTDFEEVDDEFSWAPQLEHGDADVRCVQLRDAGAAVRCLLLPRGAESAADWGPAAAVVAPRVVVVLRGRLSDLRRERAAAATFYRALSGRCDILWCSVSETAFSQDVPHDGSADAGAATAVRAAAVGPSDWPAAMRLVDALHSDVHARDAVWAGKMALTRHFILLGQQLADARSADRAWAERPASRVADPSFLFAEGAAAKTAGTVQVPLSVADLLDVSASEGDGATLRAAQAVSDKSAREAMAAATASTSASERSSPSSDQPMSLPAAAVPERAPGAAEDAAAGRAPAALAVVAHGESAARVLELLAMPAHSPRHCAALDAALVVLHCPVLVRTKQGFVRQWRSEALARDVRWCRKLHGMAAACLGGTRAGALFARLGAGAGADRLRALGALSDDEEGGAKRGRGVPRRAQERMLADARYFVAVAQEAVTAESHILHHGGADGVAELRYRWGGGLWSPQAELERARERIRVIYAHWDERVGSAESKAVYDTLGNDRCEWPLRTGSDPCNAVGGPRLARAVARALARG